MYTQHMNPRSYCCLAQSIHMCTILIQCNTTKEEVHIHVQHALGVCVDFGLVKYMLAYVCVIIML